VLHYTLPAGPHAAGATVGESDLLPLIHLLKQKRQEPEASIIVLDFAGIVSATGSYLKATVLWLLRCGQLSAADQHRPAGDMPTQDHWAIRPLAIYPVVTGLNSEVRGELQMVLNNNALPLLEVADSKGDILTKGRLIGTLDPTLLLTLQRLAKIGPSSASSLAAHYPEERVTTTAWNNRLAELHRLRLVTRTKEGRQFFYTALVREITNG
jgi:hypothetical protein